MRKALLTVLSLLLWTADAAAQQVYETPFEADIRLGVWSVSKDKNAGMAAKYDYLHSSAAGSVNLEWDPLPHRFVIDSYYLNQKDYFTDMDYSWKDVVVFNYLGRGLFHNIEHLRFGDDDPLTTLPSFTDRNPGDEYGVQESISRAFLRLKTPDFPFHLYADVRTVDREGNLQQRFVSPSGPAKISESREYETHGQEVTVGTNSHLGPVEMDYNHSEKTIEVLGTKVLHDTYPPSTNAIAHNLIPDLESSADSVKIHTSHTGRFVAAATYVSGEKKNKDSNSEAEYSMAAGDITWIPINQLAVFLKYRHYELDMANPNTVTVATLTNPADTFNVRNSISSSRDVIIGTARYRVSGRLSVKYEYSADAYDREVGPVGTNLPSPPNNIPAAWNLPKETVKGTHKLGGVFRAGRTLLLRADYSHMNVDNPAYKTDPDKADYVKSTLTWTPVKDVNLAAGYSGAREKRDLDPPLAGGKRDASRDQAFGSVTVLTGKRSSLSANYAYYKTTIEQGFTFTDSGGNKTLEGGVPYADKAQSGSLLMTFSPQDGVTLAVGAKRTIAEGRFRNSGAPAFGIGTDGIAEFSDIELVESEFSAGLEVRYTKLIGYDVQYKFIDWNDKLDNTLDGTAQTVLALVSLKW